MGNNISEYKEGRDYVRAKDAAKMLGVSENRVYQLAVKERRIDYFQLPNVERAINCYMIDSIKRYKQVMCANVHIHRAIP